VKQPKPSPRSRKLQANRKVAVFVSLVATVALTSLLLLALATPPLTGSAWRNLFAVDAPESLDAIFQTQVPAAPGRWRYIYVHHSRTTGGDAVSLSTPTGDNPLAFSDHFIIGNGDGCVDGEVQMTQAWNHQEGIRNTPPGAKLSSACVSICLIGDFSRTRPTAAQQRRLTQLVQALQARLHIPAEAVFTHPEVDSPAGIGHAFPASDFRQQLLQP
jgi:N-acetyl-anhydromuramyl-L-alanine amidase AmpD